MTNRVTSTTGELGPTATEGSVETVASWVVGRLTERIRAGSVRGGQPLRQSDVAAELGVSITPVREAFAVLERQGLVERRTHRGVVVFEPTVDDLVAHYQIREGLEGVAAREAARRLSEDDLGWLASCSEEMRACRDDSRFLALNEAFHQRIEQASGNPRLAELIAEQRATTNSYVLYLGGEPASYSETHREHDAIVAALGTRRPDRAAKAVVAHIYARQAAMQARFREPVPSAEPVSVAERP